MISNKHRATIAGALVIPALLLGACGKKTDDAEPGSDVVAEKPLSVLSGRTLDQAASE